MKSIVLQKFANREIRIGWQDLPSSRPKSDDPKPVIDASKEAALVAFSAVNLFPSPTGTYAYDPSKPSATKLNHDETSRFKTQVQRALDITSEFRRGRAIKRNNKKVPGTPNRRTVFGRNARHTLLEAGSVAERWAGSVQNSVVLTLTLPGSTEDAYRVLAAWSGYIGDRLFRTLRKAGSRTRWFYVWELQKRGALHMHVCISAKSSITAIYAGSKLRSQWIKILEDVGHKSGVDLFLHAKGDRCTIRGLWQNDLQQCKRSVAAYFTKYASKEVESARRGFDGKARVHEYYPSRWWGCQRTLRQELEQERFQIRLEGIEEDKVCEALILVDNWANAHNPIYRHRYDFQLTYLSHGKDCSLGYGERHIIYFDDNNFVHVCNDLHQMAKYLVHLCNASYVQCNRMSAIESTCLQRSMQ
jgi:hypothetical protein